MKTELLSTVPLASVRHLVNLPASAHLRVFMAIALASPSNGQAAVSATDLASLTGLTERTVFSALAYLEQHGYIARESRGPGPFANVVRIVQTVIGDN
jgi:DNA-binding MarR family transcriptional regulator